MNDQSGSAQLPQTAQGIGDLAPPTPNTTPRETATETLEIDLPEAVNDNDR